MLMSSPGDQSRSIGSVKVRSFHCGSGTTPIAAPVMSIGGVEPKPNRRSCTGNCSLWLTYFS